MKKRILETDVFALLGDIFKKHKHPGFVGIGEDDCALVPTGDSDTCMAITTDFIRGTGYSLFRIGRLDYYDLGYYLAVANLSDLASTGARPTGLLLVLRYSENMTIDDVSYTLRGFRNAVDEHGAGAMLLGGDSGSYESDVLSATAFGTVQRECALLRGDAKPGDLLCVTGPIGGNGTAIAYFNHFKGEKEVLKEIEEKNIMRYWKSPWPRVKEGLLLSSGDLLSSGNNCKRIANACMDISDGLTATIEEISRKSKVNFTVYGDKIPVLPETIKISNHFDVNLYDLAMGVSADFELVFTVAKENKELLESVFRKNRCNFHIIGETNSSDKNIFVSEHRKGKLPGMVWSHQPFSEVIESWKKK